MGNKLTMTDTEAATVSHLLYDALATTAPEQWADYDETLSLFCRIANTSLLRMFLDDTYNGEQRQYVEGVIARRD